MFIQQNWRSEMESVAAAIDGVYGECVIVTPTIFRPNHQPMPDVSKSFQTIAAFSWRNVMKFKQNSGTSFQTQEPFVESREPIFSFSRHNLPTGLQRLWQITRLCDGNVFEITKISPDDVARIIVKAVQLGKQIQ